MRKKQVFLLILLMVALFTNSLRAEIVEISKTVRIEVVDGKTYEITERILLDTDTGEEKEVITVIELITE
ncbi:MAG: hypothetical protein CR982_01475 [Candidatus Cloacimonadota bacterium]|nr:MAG: hypothetical protein CR982_01475 [Candidatus Cloacimonadota bacterium]PIE80004.1 MAG: hypothetical protein CSA15_02370 [Candidatus Delongbacteria bacterium]